MGRQRWFEIHNQPWFPTLLRDLVTEGLQAVGNENRTYRVPIRSLIGRPMAENFVGARVNLCATENTGVAGRGDVEVSGKPRRRYQIREGCEPVHDRAARRSGESREDAI